MSAAQKHTMEHEMKGLIHSRRPKTHEKGKAKAAFAIVKIVKAAF